MNNAVKYYTEVLHQDNMNIEAISCIGTHYFYTDRPEVALKFFRFKVLPIVKSYLFKTGDWFKWAFTTLNCIIIWVCAASTLNNTI